MKKLDDVFKDNKRKKASILNKKIKANKDLTVPRKVYNDDYEVIRYFAFNQRMTMLDATEFLYEMIKDEDIKIEKINIKKYEEDANKDDVKSLRISNNLNKHLRKISSEQKIPLRYLFSFLVHEHLKDEEA